jgi:cell division protein FtsL
MKKIIVTLSTITVFLFIAQIIYSCMLVGDGKEIRRIDQEITAMKGEASLLSEQVASASSILAIGEKALSLGFTQKPQVMTIHTEQFVASLVPVQ